MSKLGFRRVGFFIFDDIQALDLFGPLDTFAEVNSLILSKKLSYELVLISAQASSVKTNTGVRILADYTIETMPPLHTLIIPGGEGSRKVPSVLISQIKDACTGIKRIASVCTGLFILARTGLLDGLKATTHWQFCQQAQNDFPKVNICENDLYVRSGKYITAAGVTAGIDMTLAMIEEDYGSVIASQVAKQLVVYLKRSGGQKQYSARLQQQTKPRQQDQQIFYDLLIWVEENLNQDLSIERLSAYVCLSERHFRRKFKLIFKQSPAQKVEEIRIEVAKELLSTSCIRISEIASHVGYTNSDTFTRAFERITRLTPSYYRQRF